MQSHWGTDIQQINWGGRWEGYTVQSIAKAIIKATFLLKYFSPNIFTGTDFCLSSENSGKYFYKQNFSKKLHFIDNIFEYFAKLWWYRILDLLNFIFFQYVEHSSIWLKIGALSIDKTSHKSFSIP